MIIVNHNIAISFMNFMIKMFFYNYVQKDTLKIIHQKRSAYFK